MKTIFHILLLILTLLLMANGQLVVASSERALLLWFESLIPSMFVSMVFVKTCIALHCFDFLFYPFKRIIHCIFHMDLGSFTLVLVSLFVGFPAFAIMIDEKVEQRQLSIREGQRLVYCCSCASCSFILMSLGIACFQSLKIGLILYAIQVISVLILLFFTRKIEITCDSFDEQLPFFQAFSSAIFSSVKTMVVIVSYLMISLSLVSVANLFLPETLHEAMTIISEFSSGAIHLATSSLPFLNQMILISALLGFGGLSVHLQVHGSCSHLSLDVLSYLNYRLIQVLLVIFLSFIIFLF